MKILLPERHMADKLARVLPARAGRVPERAQRDRGRIHIAAAPGAYGPAGAHDEQQSALPGATVTAMHVTLFPERKGEPAGTSHFQLARPWMHLPVGT
jgi:hypothetical protein